MTVYALSVPKVLGESARRRIDQAVVAFLREHTFIDGEVFLRVAVTERDADWLAEIELVDPAQVSPQGCHGERVTPGLVLAPAMPSRGVSPLDVVVTQLRERDLLQRLSLAQSSIPAIPPVVLQSQGVGEGSPDLPLRGAAPEGGGLSMTQANADQASQGPS